MVSLGRGVQGMLVMAVEHAVYGTAVYGAEYKKGVAELTS